MALSCRKDCGREALHKRLRARLGLDGLPLHLVYLDEFLLDPRVPEMERHLLLLALDVELAGGNREHEVCVVLVVYNFESQATLCKNDSYMSKQGQSLIFDLPSGSILPRGLCVRQLPTSE